MHGQSGSGLSRSHDSNAGDDDDDDLINPGSPTVMDDTDDEELSLGAHSPQPDLRCSSVGGQQDDVSGDIQRPTTLSNLCDSIAPQLIVTTSTMSLTPSSVPTSIRSPAIHPSISSSSPSSASPTTSISPHAISRLSPHQISPTSPQHRLSPNNHSRSSTPIISCSSFIKSEPQCPSSLVLDSITRPLSLHPVTTLPLMSSLSGSLSAPLGFNGFNHLPFSSEGFRFPHHSLFSAQHQLFPPLGFHHTFPLVAPHHNPLFPALQPHAHSTS